MKVGVISDTHGYIQPAVYTIFADVDLILHAGDIGNEDIITSLEAIAPVKAIHGNIDTFPLTTRYPSALSIELGGIHICMVHQFIRLDQPDIEQSVQTFPQGKPDLIIYGHSHRAMLQRQDHVLLFNPGSAGKPRFSLRPAVGILTIGSDGFFVPKIIYVDAN